LRNLIKIILILP